MAKELRHLAIIMDGNGRWARKRGLPRLLGHRAGIHALEKIVYGARDRGIRYLSVYAFSTENWKRPVMEVTGLMKLFSYYAGKKIKKLKKEEIRVRFAGRRNNLPDFVLKTMEMTERETMNCSAMDLIGCFNYGGRQEIVDSVNSFIASHPGEPITEEDISNHAYLPDVPDPDLIVRTSGELRLSNFWLWQGSYSELYFTDVLWPDFSVEILDKAKSGFEMRDRRYGGLN